MGSATQVMLTNEFWLRNLLNINVVYARKLTQSITCWLMLCFRVLLDQQLHQRMKQGFASFPNIMDKLEETEIEGELFL